MSERRSFYRKIAYFIGIAVLLLPLSALSMPSSTTTSGEKPGGKLARLRSENNLSQSNLGEIDPASETMKLATLGFRGIAANVLWSQANHYKKVEDWTNLSATLEQITKLQPNFITVWQFQGWNLSYNVSVEFDDYRDRYAWVIRGINFLKMGEQYNKDEPRLLEDIGRFIAHKIGRADEHKQFRRLFKEDEDFHPPERPREERDNWLVGKEWYLKAQEVVDTKGKSLRGKSPHIFHSYPAMAQINYAEALEKDGIHGEVARAQWKRAAEDWHDFGSRTVMSTFGIRINLNDEERTREEVQKYQQQVNELSDGLYDKIAEERQAALTDEERMVLEIPAAEQTDAQRELFYQTEQKLTVSHRDVVQRLQTSASADSENLREALRLARLAMDGAERARIINRYRDNVNFLYWRTRCEFEQTPDALAARELTYKGDEALERADLLTAKELYDRGMQHWRKVFDAYPMVLEDSTAGDDLLDVIARYRDILNEIDEEFPQDFILRDVVELHDHEGKLQGLFGPASSEEASSSDEATPADEASGEADDASDEAGEASGDELPSEEPQTEV